MTIQGRKEEKQVVIKHKTTIYTEACNLAMKIAESWQGWSQRGARGLWPPLEHAGPPSEGKNNFFGDFKY